MPEPVTLSREGPISILRIDRPPVNALSAETLKGILRALREARQDPPRALVVTGGERVFSAGADVKEMAGTGEPRAAYELARRGQGILGAFWGSPFPTIAAIEGFCLGGGFELALACHLRVASETAKLGLPECGIGLLPGYGGTQRLARLAGFGAAAEVILAGRVLSGKEAEARGIVQRSAPEGQALAAARALGEAIAKRSRSAVRASLEALRGTFERGLDRGLNLEARLFMRQWAEPDRREGLAAFAEKRPPSFP